MPINQQDGMIFLDGIIGVEDAEALYTLLMQNNINAINAGSCQHMHAAVLQLIIGFNLHINQYPDNPALKHWLANSLSLSHSVATDNAYEVNNG